MGLRNETGRSDFRAVWDEGAALRGYRPWWMVFLVGAVVGFFIPRTGALLAGVVGGLLIVDFFTIVTGVVLGAICRRAENRSRLRRAAMVFGFAVLGSIPGGLLLAFL